MAFDVSYSLENEQQFWDELDDIVSTRCTDHGVIDNALRSYFNVTTSYKAEYLATEYRMAQCTYGLLSGHLFAAHKDYVRRQMVHGLLQEDDTATLHLAAAFLLYDGRSDDRDGAFAMLREEGGFPRLVELIQGPTVRADVRLHQLLLELMYEASRMQRLTWADLEAVDDAFVVSLLDIIEGVSDDVEDPYHYPVIRVLLVLNEQYLVASTTVPARQHAAHSPVLTNRVIKVLATHSTPYKTFGCNLILLLNRESETSLQLLILKALYLLFGHPHTAEYFYTNDLHVLVDVVLRNLLDLPADGPATTALRHTYLRVLHNMLAHSQIARPPHYKRHDILRILASLAANGGAHFAPVDDTTLRLVRRCESVGWLQRGSAAASDDNSPATDDGAAAGHAQAAPPANGVANGVGHAEVARHSLGMSVQSAGESFTSVAEVAAQTEKPGIQTPSRIRRTQR